MNFLQSIVVAICLFVSVPIWAQGNTSEPAQNAAVQLSAHDTVKATTDRVMRIILDAQNYFEKDPNRFYKEVEGVFGDLVDFDSFARGVMGDYATKKSYKALKTKEEKKQFKARIARFSSVFKNGLVQTYATGLLAFEGNRVEIIPPKPVDNAKKSVTVIQHIYGSNGDKPYVVHYKMKRNRAGVWKLRNVTIEAINLGYVYKSQFASAVKQYNGDIDQVIDNWSVDPTQTQDKAS